MTITLTINGAPQDLSARRLSLGSLRVSWTAPRRLVFTQHVAHTAADFGVEDNVLLAVDGAVRFRGRIKRVEHQGKPGAESVVYTALGPRELARAVTVRDPDSAVPRIVFNAPDDDDDYDPARSGLTVGDIIAWLFDNHADELRAAAAIPDAPATGYVQAELDALAVVTPKLVLDSLDFDAALTLLLRFQRGHRLIVAPDSLTWHFRALAGLPEKTITYNSPDRPLSALLKPSTRARATAVEIVGPPRPVINTLYVSTGGLAKLWDGDLEADWTWTKCFDPANDDTYAHVFRRFQVADQSKRRLAPVLPEPASLGEHPVSRAPQVYRKTADGAWAPVPASFDFTNGIFTLAQPATSGDEYGEGAAVCADDVCLVCACLAEPLVTRWPDSGYEGTAYTQPTNPVQVVRRLYDEAFLLAEQESDYQALARELLRDWKDIAYAGSVSLAVIDGSLADLNCRLNFAAQDDEGAPVETGFESIRAVPLAVTYDFLRSRTVIKLSTEPPDSARGTGATPPQLRELANQAVRSQRARALDGALSAPVARLGNDGQTGAPATARGVYSIRRTEDGPGDRLAGHIDLEAGMGIAITRQGDSEHNGFRIDATKRGEWFWFHYQLTSADADKTIDMFARRDPLGTEEFAVNWYPLFATRLTRLIIYTTGQLTAGTVTLKPARKTRTSGACPEDRTDYDTPAAALTTSTNIARAAADPGIDYSDDDLLGLRVTTSSDFAIPANTLNLLAAAYLEEPA